MKYLNRSRYLKDMLQKYEIKMIKYLSKWLQSKKDEGNQGKKQSEIYNDITQY